MQFTYATIVAVFAAVVAAQDESGAHDGLLPLTTLPLTNQAGSTTGSETLYATAVITSTLANGAVTTVYSDLSGVVGPSSEAASTVVTTSVVSSASGSASLSATTGVAITTSVSGSAVTLTGTLVTVTGTSSSLVVPGLSSVSGSPSGSASGSNVTVSTGASASASASANASASATKSGSSTASSSGATASSTGTSAGDRISVGGFMGLAGTLVAGLFAL